MRIGDLVNQALLPQKLSDAYAAAAKRSAQASGGAGGNTSDGRPQYSVAKVDAPTTQAPAAPTTQAPKQFDVADLSSAGSVSTPASQSAGATSGQAQDSTGSQGLSFPGGGYIEAYQRRRAILAYHVPGPNGTSMDLTFDVETAYHTVQFVPPGSTVDTTA